MYQRLVVAALAIGLSASTVWAQAQPMAEENTGPNLNIARWAEGRYDYLTIKEKRSRGTERFYMNVHADGTRTMMMWHDVAARNAQFTVLLRVEKSFRPLEAFLNYWTQAGYKGSTRITVNGGELTAENNGPLGHLTQTVKVPDHISLGTHPISADGWHMWYVDAKAKGAQTGATYFMDASADLSRPALGSLQPQQFEAFGKATVVVPAGTFDALHYRIAGATDVWITEQDHLMIRMLNERSDREYLLMDFKTGRGGAKE